MKTFRFSSSVTEWRAIPAFAFGLALAVSGCNQPPLPATPAIWHVKSAEGREGWLFGTIHAASKPLAWRTHAVDQALGKAGVIVVEVANLNDEKAVAETFSRLSRTPDLTPITQRVAPIQRDRLAASLDQRGLKANNLEDVETWAVALTLARPAQGKGAQNGVDRALLAVSENKPVIELEGADAQLSIFDRLPESEQRDLLHFVLADDTALEDPEKLLTAWRKGDMAQIEAETRSGMLTDPELRQALFTDRNRNWISKIDTLIRDGKRPFVAVGAAHMVGPDGLIAMLKTKGYTVTRLQ